MLRLGDLRVGWGKLFELRQALTRIRTAGKPVVVYFADNPSDGEYYLASAADWLVCPPVSVINLDGLRAEATFFTGTMEKLGIKAEFERIGKYKSAVEQYTRRSLSAAAREAREAILDDIFAELTTAISRGRQMPVTRVKELIDHGAHASVEAKDAGLIDQIAYEDELDEIVRQKIARSGRRVNLATLTNRKHYRYEWGPQPKIAVVVAAGTILGGHDRDDFLLGRVMGARTVAAALRQARSDCNVKAIVLRIDSPGGSGIASDLIWREVKKTIGVKPLIVSMSDVAASGGYYIACAADSVFALPTTITGSIGVFAGKVSLADLYQKIGINKEVSTRGAFADMFSLNRSFTDEERKIVRHQVELFYANFLKIVAEGRHRSTAQIDSVAQGRVWTGKAALDVGLIDNYGGLLYAITTAVKMAGIEDRDYRVEVLPRSRWSPPAWLQGLTFLSRTFDEETFTGLSDLTDEHLWYLLPWRLTIK